MKNVICLSLFLILVSLPLSLSFAQDNQNSSAAAQNTGQQPKRRHAKKDKSQKDLQAGVRCARLHSKGK